MTAAVRYNVVYLLTQTCLSIPQFGSCSSFGTFRPAFSHTGTIRPLSVILPASPTFNHSPGSNTPSPTSKVPSWKVCFHLQIFLWVLSFETLLLLCFLCFVAFADFAFRRITSQSLFCSLLFSNVSTKKLC